MLKTDDIDSIVEENFLIHVALDFFYIKRLLQSLDYKWKPSWFKYRDILNEKPPSKYRLRISISDNCCQIMIVHVR